MITAIYRTDTHHFNWFLIKLSTWTKLFDSYGLPLKDGTSYFSLRSKIALWKVFFRASVCFCPCT